VYVPLASVRMSSQLVGDADTHMLIVQIRPKPHALPQVPQFARSLVRSRHVPEHAVRPVLQEAMHELALQVVPAAHTLPHVPQLRGSSVVSTHAVPHVVGVAAGQLTMHALPEQISPTPHAVAQSPQ